jgi:hypothetical protein
MHSRRFSNVDFSEEIPKVKYENITSEKSNSPTFSEMNMPEQIMVISESSESEYELDKTLLTKRFFRSENDIKRKWYFATIDKKTQLELRDKYYKDQIKM